MKEDDLRAMIAEVRDGRLSRRGFIGRMVALGLTAPLAVQMLSHSGVAQAQETFVYKPTKRGGGGRAQGAVVAGADPAQPAFRRRHQGSGGLAHLLRAAGGWDPDGNLVPVLAAEIPTHRERRAGQGRQVGHLEAEAGRQVARRQAVHRRRFRVQLGICRRPGNRGDDDRQLQGRQSRQGRRPHDPRRFPEADAVLGGRLRRRRRHDHPEAPVRGLQGRQVARCAGEPEAGRHRPLPVCRASSRAIWCRASATPTITCPTGRISTRSR